MSKSLLMFLASLTLITMAFPLMGAHHFSIENPWVRIPPKGSAVTAGYGKFTNQNSETDYLVSASCSAAASVELHQSRRDPLTGAMSMTPVENIPMPPKQMVELKPGGYHLMLMHLQTSQWEAAQKNRKLTITMFFKSGLKQEVEFSLQEIGGGQVPSHSAHH